MVVLHGEEDDAGAATQPGTRTNALAEGARVRQQLRLVERRRHVPAQGGMESPRLREEQPSRSLGDSDATGTHDHEGAGKAPPVLRNGVDDGGAKQSSR